MPEDIKIYINETVRHCTDSAIQALTNHVNEINIATKVQTAHFEDIKATLKRIEEQTMKTNGRVSKLEFWQNKIVGAIIIISTIVLSLVAYSFNLAVTK